MKTAQDVITTNQSYNIHTLKDVPIRALIDAQQHFDQALFNGDIEWSLDIDALSYVIKQRLEQEKEQENYLATAVAQPRRTLKDEQAEQNWLNNELYGKEQA